MYLIDLTIFLLSPTIDTFFCEKCVCRSECDYFDLVGDGYCEDLVNTAVCNFDGGDCCGKHVNVEYCEECQCIANEEGILIL